MIVLFCITTCSIGGVSFLYSPRDRVHCQTLGHVINLGEKWYFSEVLISLSLIMWCWVSFHMFKGHFHFLFCELSISFADFSIRLSFSPSVFQRPLCNCDMSSLYINCIFFSELVICPFTGSEHSSSFSCKIHLLGFLPTGFCIGLANGTSVRGLAARERNRYIHPFHPGWGGL